MIQFPGSLELEDERVLLRPLKESDLEYLLPFALNEPEIWTYSAVSVAGENGAGRNQISLVIFHTERQTMRWWLKLGRESELDLRSVSLFAGR